MRNGSARERYQQVQVGVVAVHSGANYGVAAGAVSVGVAAGAVSVGVAAGAVSGPLRVFRTA